jgi:hypothetical protein
MEIKRVFHAFLLSKLNQNNNMPTKILFEFATSINSFKHFLVFTNCAGGDIVWEPGTYDTTGMHP